MDEAQFDALVARLAASPSRRDALKGLVGGALGTIPVTSVATAERGKKRQGRGRKRSERRKRNDDRRDGGGEAERIGRRRAHRRHKNHARKNDKNEKKKKEKKDRCKKNGKPCARDGKCCSGHCNQETSRCVRRPVS